jgi:hypothetical protein
MSSPIVRVRAAVASGAAVAHTLVALTLFPPLIAVVVGTALGVATSRVLVSISAVAAREVS